MEDADQEVIDGILDSNNYRTLAFVKLAYGFGAVTSAEIREWVWHMLDVLDEDQVLRLPPTFFDLSEFDGKRMEDFIQQCGPCSGPYDRDIDCRAMSAIAWRRGVKTEWVFCKREVAERNLAKKPEIETLFRATFPFIEW